MAKQKRNAFTYNSELVFVIDTSLGKIRTIRSNRYFVCIDLVRAFNLKDTFSIKTVVDDKYVKTLVGNEAKKFGFHSNGHGTMVMSYAGVVQYSKKCRGDRTLIDWKTFLSELKSSVGRECEQEQFNTEKANETNFAGNYFLNLNLETREIIKKELVNKNKELEATREKITREINENQSVINQLKELEV